MKLDDFLQGKSEWLKGEGPKSSIVMSTRVRVARNLNGRLFFNWADDKQREGTLEAMLSALKKSELLKGALCIRMEDTNMLDREFLVERHLMSKEHTLDVKYKGLVIGDKEIVSIILNEEDHMRLQVLQSGFNIMEAWRIVDDIDMELGRYLTFAYSSKFGYLTACPTNTGTGLRASVMLHLPALQITEQMENVYEAISKLGLTIRGFYGEGTEAFGNFFQISNQVALGHSEMDILDNLERVINKIIIREEDTRTYLAKHKKQEITDNIFRSYGTLKSARIITSRETIKLLSSVRLGVDMGLIKDLDTGTLNELLLLMQAAHLQKTSNMKLNAQERDIKRANLVREKLTGG
ncbi:MAG: protein arginine kinase [Candidatus Omnitrophica bacterium]|nr:protein arginine kinase [Candidatus Omnitrophota bacterium]